MRICFANYEIFALGYYGGFGRLNRIIGRELVKRGIEVQQTSGLELKVGGGRVWKR